MITLKKSFELQNYMRKLLDGALAVLRYNENITKTTQEHMRKKVYAEAEDETVIKPKLYEYDINTLIDFTCFIQEQISSLTAAINDAKRCSAHDLDGMIATNNQKRKLMERMADMSSLKPREAMVKGVGTKFNSDGNQVTYTYDIKEITVIDFDRNKTKAIASRLRRELDETSTTIDKMMLDTVVFYDSIFEIGDTLEEAIARYVAENEKADTE